MTRELWQMLFSDVPMMRSDVLASMMFVPEGLERAEASLMRVFAEVCHGEHPGLAAVRETLHDRTAMVDKIAVVPVRGAMAYQPSTMAMMFDGLSDSSVIQRNIRMAARDPKCEGIVLDCNTPGGMHKGGAEVAAEVASAARVKPVVAHTAGDMASLGYVTGSQASMVMATASASVGSIGSIITFTDLSRMAEMRGMRMEVITNKEATAKGAGIPGTSLSEAQRAYLQDRCDKAYGQFKSAVTSARPQARSEAMDGRSFYGDEAKSLGLTDAVGDLEFAVSHCRRMAGK